MVIRKDHTMLALLSNYRKLYCTIFCTQHSVWSSKFEGCIQNAIYAKKVNKGEWGIRKYVLLVE